MTQGEILYQDIPFNHQRLMADISFLIQSYFNPINIPELILRHRQSLILFSFVMNILIFFRFGLPALGFILFFEFSKFYIFGDRFLAESFIVYPFVYLLGLLWLKLKNQKIHNLEYVFIGIFVWFIVFAREPFIIAALLLFFLLLWGKPFSQYKKLSLLIFILLSSVLIFISPINDYLYDVFFINKNWIVAAEIKSGELMGVGLFKAFFYPFYLFTDGEWNIFRSFILTMDMAFIALIFSAILRKKLKRVILIFLVLGLSNIRYNIPGTIFYSAFHMVPWYGMFIFTLLLMLKEEIRFNKPIFTFSFLMLILSGGLLLFSPQSFLKEKADPHSEFLTNYGNYLQVGGVISSLSSKSDTLFVDGFDELIHWQAKIPSSYKYNWYTSFMPHFSKFRNEREKMFIDNPPDFYYGSCPKDENAIRIMPDRAKKNYIRLLSKGDPTCLFIKKEKLKEIKDEQWEKAAEFLYDRPV